MKSYRSPESGSATAVAQKPPVRRKIITAVCLLVGLSIAAIIWLGGSGTVSFTMVLDGKPLPVSVQPEVLIDGKPYSPNLTHRPGLHRLVANLPNAEQFTRRVWIIWGNREIGTLPLSSLKGGINIVVSPSPAAVILRQGTEKLMSGEAPLAFKDLPIGSYVVEVKRGEYSEYKDVEVTVGKLAELNIALNIGSLDLSTTPADANFELTGNGRMWHGQLPAHVADVPVGDYQFAARRKGWEINTTLSVARGEMRTSKLEFPYGSIDVSGDPAGLAIALDGVVVGTTPVTIRELKPGSYTLTATDGENERSADIAVGPKEQARHSFAFRYGTVQLTSTPTGATVIRKGKEIGITPLTLEHLAVDVSGVVELRLTGYSPVTDFALKVVEGVTTNLNAKLFSERYLQAMKQAHESLNVARFSESQKFLAAALESEPGDSAALELRDEVSKAEEAFRTEQANANARALASLPWLDFDRILADCTDAKQVQYTVEIADGYRQEYIDKKGKKRTRFVRTGSHTENRTRTDYTFNFARFSQKYQGRTFRFNCPGDWRVLKIEKDSSIILKAGGMGSAEIKMTASWNHRDAMSSLKKGQKIAIKGVLNGYKPGELFVPQSLILGDVELLDQ